jgi:predicted nuclease with RNAse H fold
MSRAQPSLVGGTTLNVGQAGPPGYADEQSAARAGLSRSPLVCGIDLGGSSTASYVAWLDGTRIVFDMYRATPQSPLPPPPGDRPVAAYAFDGPQGLPADPGDGRRACRVADRAAGTPTRSLPTTPAGLRDLALYGAFVRNAVALFWRLQEAGDVTVLGLEPGPRGLDRRPVACEAWPRLVLRRLAGEGARLPVKRREPEAYARAVWRLMQGQGLGAEGLLCPTVDQADAALCALAARAVTTGAVHRLGRAPWPDTAAGFLREGFVVAP